MRRMAILMFLLAAAVVLLFVLNLFVGQVSVPASQTLSILMGVGGQNEWSYIVLNSRLPQACTAVLSGMSLAVSGLLLQTGFRNPLAGPSIFGVSSGAALGAALVMLLVPPVSVAGWALAVQLPMVVVGAFVGAMVVTVVIFMFSLRLSSHVSLLIVGIMIGYLASSAILLLNFFATEQGVHSYLVWGMGDFSGVAIGQLPVFAILTFVALAVVACLPKSLNLLLMGEDYATNLGVNVRQVRISLLLTTSLLTATATAFCGPIAFIGLAVPHLSRLIFATSDHRWLLPATLLTGSGVCLMCNLVATGLPQVGIVPLNAITPLVGAPVVIYILMRR